MALQEKLDKGRFVVTLEIQPAIDDDLYRLLERMDCLKGRVDLLNVSELRKPTEEADSLGTSKALLGKKFDVIFQTTTRHKHRPDLEADLLEANRIGVQNILVFAEGYTLTGSSPEEKLFFHVDSAKLFSVLENLKSGCDLKGYELPSPVTFNVGSGTDAARGKQTPTQQLREMEQLVEQGARFFQTTPVFDLDEFRSFMKLVEPFGVPVLAGVMLLRTAGMARFAQSNLNVHVPEWIVEKLATAPDKLKASIEIFTYLVGGLRDLCQGIHVIPFGWYTELPRFFDAAKLF